MIDETLVPPDDLLSDGPGKREEFIEDGVGLLWNGLVARAGLKPDMAVLDIGSGDGKHARVLAEFLNSEGKYRGFDINANGVKWCQEHYAKFPSFEFKLADIYSDWYNPNSNVSPSSYIFPYDDATFDVVFAASLFTHLEPDAAQNYFLQTVRVLKPVGRLFFTCFLINESNMGLHVQDVQGRRFVQASQVHYVIDPEKPSRGVAYKEAAIRSMLNIAGFVVSEINFGTWSNGIDVISAFQDIIVAVKPLHRQSLNPQQVKSQTRWRFFGR
jgi:ubiquinone/menaquinone biosynthesis C-methylase UbiE